MINHLFIGLGGQGGNSIAALRKVIANRESDKKTLEEKGVNWRFLYIDSSRDVANTRKNWTHFGQNLELDPDSFLYLKDDGGEINVAAMAQLPDIAPWIGNHTKLDAFLRGTQGIVGANQRRRLGRVLYARNADKIRNACKEKISPMLSASNRCAIHIFASLAGGTGSGGIVDLVTMLRTEFPNSSTDNGFPIFLYLYTTDLKFQNAEVGYFHENQAAVLKDLNALCCGAYKPNMLGAALNGMLFKGTQPITQIILNSNLNGKNQMLSLEQQHQISAEAAFERIYCFATGNLNTDQQRAITGEDIQSAFPGEPARNPMRTYRFASSGMRRWEVPIDEIRELLASDILAASLNTLLYRNWIGTLGAACEKLSSNVQGYSDTLDAIFAFISSQKVTQSDLPQLIENLNTEVNRYHDGKKREGFKELDLDDYEQGIRERYLSHFHEHGVDAIFKDLSSRRESRIERLESTIHDILKRAWVRSSQPLGLHYVHDLLLEVQSKLRKEIDNARQVETRDKAIETRMQLRKAEWDKLTFLSRPFRMARLARAHQSDLLSNLRQDLRFRAEQVDSETLEILCRNLGQLASDYKLASDALLEKSKSATKSYERLFDDLKSLKSDEKGVQDGKLSNKAEVSIKELESYITEQRLEKEQLFNTCDELIDKGINDALGDYQLTKLGRLTEPQKLKFDEITELIAFKRATHIHDAIVSRTHREPILTGHILDILQDRFQENSEKFKAELKGFIDSSASSILLASSEIQPKSLRSDTGMPPMPRQSLVIGIPSAHAFGNELRKLIKPLMDAGSITVHSVYEHDDPTQIRMLTMTYWMAARFAKVVHGLEAIYKTSIENDRDGDKRYFTSIDPSGEKGERPSILLPSPEEAQSQVRAALWLGSKLLAPGTDQILIQAGPKSVVLMEVNDQSLPNPFEINGSLEDLNRNTDVTTASRIISAVEAAISILDAGRREELRSEIKAIDAKTLSISGASNPDYLAWTKDRNNLFEFLSK